MKKKNKFYYCFQVGCKKWVNNPTWHLPAQMLTIETQEQGVKYAQS